MQTTDSPLFFSIPLSSPQSLRMKKTKRKMDKKLKMRSLLSCCERNKIKM